MTSGPLPEEFIEYRGTKHIISKADPTRAIGLEITTDDATKLEDLKAVMDSFNWK